MGRAAIIGTIRKFTMMLGAAGFLTAQLALQDRDWRLGEAAGLWPVAGLCLWAFALIWLIGPWLWRSKDAAVSGALNDERVRANRNKAFAVGYGAMLLASIAMFALAITGRVEAPEAAHLIFAIGVAAPMFGFAFFD